jgi:hypothetical protein
MTATTELAEHLEFDDGSLSAADMQFSRDVAGEVRTGTRISAEQNRDSR